MDFPLECPSRVPRRMRVLIEGFVAAYHPTAEPFQWREAEFKTCGSTQPSIYWSIYSSATREATVAETRTAKLFKNGSSQAVRLPAEFRFEGEEVYISRNEVTGDVVLSTHPGERAWAEFFELMDTIDVPSDFMDERPMNVPPPERDVFADEGR